MQNALYSKPQDVTLYNSITENGLFINLLVTDFAKKHVEHLFWRTSYPMLDFLYPHWWKKKEIFSENDFWWEAHKVAEKLFNWELMGFNRILKIPNEGFGSGITDAFIVQHPNAKVDMFDYNQKDVTVRRLQDTHITETFHDYLEDFEDKVVIIVLNFLSLSIYEFTPKYLGIAKKWEVKNTKVSFNSPTEFLDRIVSKRFISFLGTDIPVEHIFNTIMNYLYWKPAVTSSEETKDIFRAVYTEMFAEISSYTTINDSHKGNIILTGEVPAFFNDRAFCELMIVDGIGVSGTWAIYTDPYALFIPMLLKTQAYGRMPLNMVVPSAETWVIPQKVSDRDIVKTIIDDKEYLATSGNIFRYKINSYSKNIHSTLGKDKERMSFSMATGMKIKSLVIDSRKWPVVYGPSPSSNIARVPAWLQRLKNYVN